MKEKKKNEKETRENLSLADLSMWTTEVKD